MNVIDKRNAATSVAYTQDNKAEASAYLRLDRSDAMVSEKTKKRYIEPIIRTIAGVYILVFSLLLFKGSSLAILWLGFLLFLGFNLFQSGLSGFCLMERFLKLIGLTSELDDIKSLSGDLKLTTDQQANYLDTLNLLNEAVVELTSDGYIISASDGWARLTGKKIDITLKRSLRSFFIEQDQPLLNNLHDRLKRQTSHTLRFNLRLRADAHRAKWINANFTLTDSGVSPIIKGILSDVSDVKNLENERQQIQQELTHTRRLSNLGEMAAGLSHELNQPLAAINLYIQGCLKRLEDKPAIDPEIIEAMHSAQAQAKRAGNIIEQVRSFVRKAPLNKNDTAINDLIAETMHLLDVDPDVQDIEFHYELANDLPFILLDRLQIQQVLVNLVYNAIDSMPEQERKIIILRAQQQANTVVVEVIDNGKGVPKNIAKNMFEAFVTGREDGLGLGLAICRSIIELHGGTLQHENNEAGGSCFRFSLPIQIG
ncbi:hypothetical protein MNBD_GAMMA06-887 [hydrothermal vent metagenome]|uniref:Histidine kinase domain-containing protein n=1 Tax=hydrothermal vent metagenome TaxID=652676 RepID=A0A3B0W7Y9_9ZZZZ